LNGVKVKRFMITVVVLWDW